MEKGGSYITHTYFPKLVKLLEALERNPHITYEELAKELGCSIHMISPKIRQLRDLPERIKQEQRFIEILQEVQLRAEMVLQKRYRR